MILPWTPPGFYKSSLCIHRSFWPPCIRGNSRCVPLGALGVYFRALGLVTDRSVLRAHARAVRVAREEAFPELVHEATVIHAGFSSVVIENDVIVGSSLGLIRGGIVLRADRGRRDSGVQGEQHDANRREKRAHPSPRQSDAFKESVSGPLSCKSPCCKYDTERNVNNP